MPQKAVAAAERIRKDIEKDPVEYKSGTNVRVTATIGVSEFTSGATIESMMEDADAKLYYGKKHGKNQVVAEFS
ncbi:GGDEF domain-containing protein [Pseudobutyrivibrio xylanivorans]|uniref:Diguanylate cyclase (GGDEF) domain-containing protein n=1 Tax=Pseudobutyrivibrio xylanivorans DSM 14809 TaxID=1123012 RepID=A0A1M6HWA4_PSEXY|nr:diguanylate cyclase [Pseudobutyrivibrio xylanivorans]SHJ26489.1 diguanylate cyclase (GGDEF) domain-containing protein [Pseudobutyrivibrio xylanivorans DSM 14809]